MDERVGYRSPYTVARFVLDTSDVIERWNSPAEYLDLEQLRNENRVVLAKTDVVDAELDPNKNFVLGGVFLASIDLLELHGPMVFDNSRLGHSVFASEEDVIRLDRVKTLIKVREASTRNNKHDERDAMHLATSIRYGFSGLITGDHRLLKLDKEFSQEFGFRIFNVADAVSFANQLISKQLKLEKLNELLVRQFD
jgi:predicted nucleic acid-binding protein